MTRCIDVYVVVYNNDNVYMNKNTMHWFSTFNKYFWICFIASYLQCIHEHERMLYIAIPGFSGVRQFFMYFL